MALKAKRAMKTQSIGTSTPTAGTPPSAAVVDAYGPPILLSNGQPICSGLDHT